MLMFTFMLIAAGCAVAVYRWRWGVFAAIAMVLVQDPLRKMVPGVPGYLAMCSVPIWMTTLGIAMYSGELSARQFLARFPKMGRWMSILGFYLLIPAARSLSYGRGTWKITLLGAMVYSSAFFVVLVGWNFSNRKLSLSTIFSFYAIATSVALVGGPLDYFGVAPGWKMLGTAAMDTVWMTARTGEIIYMYSGFFRSPDVMGWHAAMVVMISSLLAVRSRGWMRWVWIAISMWGFLNLWICGRRKMIAMLPVFGAMFLFLTFKFRGAGRLIALASVLLLIVAAGWYGVARTYHATAIDTLYGSTMNDWEERMTKHGIRAVVTTVRQAGFFGYGLGMGQQGVHNINAEKPRLWQEGGPGKVVAELGVPGGILFLLVGGILVLTAYHVVGFRKDDASFDLSAGTFSILISNGASAVVSAQIFGDLFIILFLVFLVGALLSEARETRPQEVL